MAASNSLVTTKIASPFVVLQTDITWDEASTGTQSIAIDYDTSLNLASVEPLLSNAYTLTTPSGVAMATYKISVNTSTQAVTVTAYSGDIAGGGAGGAPKTLVGLTTRLTMVFIAQGPQDGSTIDGDVDT